MQALGINLNIYAVPATLTLVLLVLETLFLIVALPETHNAGGKVKTDAAHSESDKKATGVGTSAKRDVTTRLKLLKSLQKFHFFFLVIFSGVEFTLTFLTFDRKNFLFSGGSLRWPDCIAITHCSSRLDQHSERKTHWFNWYHQRPTPRWLCSPSHVKSR